MGAKETSKFKKQMKKKVAKAEMNDFKMAWKHLNWLLKIFLIIGTITALWLCYKLGECIGNFLIS